MEFVGLLLASLIMVALYAAILFAVKASRKEKADA